MKDKIINAIEERIKAEFEKHKDHLEWAKIAAIKIYNEHFNTIK
jgi:hypothetical protein